MDIELENRISEAIARLQTMATDTIDYQQMDPIAKMMLVALLHETQKIQDHINGFDQRLMDRFCENFIPRQQVGAMPAIALVMPTFKKNKNHDIVAINTGVSFSSKTNRSKTTLNYLPLFRNMLLPCDDIYVLTQNRLTCKDYSCDIAMPQSNTIWVGLNTKAEVDTMDGLSVYLQHCLNVFPAHVSVVSAESKDLQFSTMDRMEDIDMLEPFDAQQASTVFLSIVSHWKTLLQELPDGVLLYINDKTKDRDVFKKRAYPRVFQNWLESDVLDCFDENTIWLQIDFPENCSVPDDCHVIVNAFPVVNIDVNTVTLTQASPMEKLQKQEDAFFLSVLETSNSSHRHGFSMNSEEIVVRDFDACCYHNGDLYRDIRNLYNHFIEDYYAFVEYNGLKDGQDIKRLKELVNNIGKSVGKQNPKFKFDCGTYVMKNIHSASPSSVTKVSYMSTQGEQGNLLGRGEAPKLECRKLPMMETNVPVIVPAMGGRDKATADERYEQIRYYSLTNDRLFTRMDIEAFVRTELIYIFGKEEFKRISVKVSIEGAAGQNSVQRGVYVDISFKDKKNYVMAEDKSLAVVLRQQIMNKSCIAMPINVCLVNNEQI